MIVMLPSPFDNSWNYFYLSLLQYLEQHETEPKRGQIITDVNYADGNIAK